MVQHEGFSLLYLAQICYLKSRNLSRIKLVLLPTPACYIQARKSILVTPSDFTAQNVLSEGTKMDHNICFCNSANHSCSR